MVAEVPAKLISEVPVFDESKGPLRTKASGAMPTVIAE